MRRRKGKPITRNQIQQEMTYFLEHGGKIKVLPAQIHAPLNRVNCASPYIDYRENIEDFLSHHAVA